MRKLNSPAYLRFTPMKIMPLMVEPLRLMPGMQAIPWMVPVRSARHKFILTPSTSGCLLPVRPHWLAKSRVAVTSRATHTARGFSNRLSRGFLNPMPIIAVGMLASTI